jgi:3,4-dihydroxy 2-butanone 4-phosphate synthase/GTP cyclohydrolase II
VRNQLGDVLGIHGAKFGLPLRTAMQAIAENGSGLLLVLGGEESDDDILHRLELREPPKVASSGDNRSAQELRTYGIGAQIIADLGIRKMRVLSAPKRFHGLSGFGLEVIEYVDLPTADAVSGKRRIG